MHTSTIGTRVAILHIAQYSLPEISSGYTIRTHAMATEQRSFGLEPIVVTSPRHPSAEGTALDGIPYLRCRPEPPARSRSAPKLIRGHSRQVQSGTSPLAWLIDEVPEGSRTTEVRSDECRRPRQARHCGTR